METSKTELKGAANKVAGNVKQEAGELVGNETLQAKGVAQETKGNLQDAQATAENAAQKGFHKVGDMIEKAGAELSKKGFEKIGDAIEKFGDKVEHAID